MSVPLILPVPLAAIPVTVAVLFLVQLYVVPETALVNTIGVIGVALQMVCAAGVATTFGVGFTVTFTTTGVPLQPPNDGVIVNATTTGAFVVFVSVPLILPVPLAAIPVTVAVLFLVQLNTVPGGVPDNTIGVMDEPEQIVCAPRLEPHPLILGTVRLVMLVQLDRLSYTLN